MSGQCKPLKSSSDIELMCKKNQLFALILESCEKLGGTGCELTNREYAQEQVNWSLKENKLDEAIACFEGLYNLNINQKETMK